MADQAFTVITQPIAEALVADTDKLSKDVEHAIAIVMRENACDSRSASSLIRGRAGALQVSLDEAASMIVLLGHTRTSGPAPNRAAA